MNNLLSTVHVFFGNLELVQGSVIGFKICKKYRNQQETCKALPVHQPLSLQRKRLLLLLLSIPLEKSVIKIVIEEINQILDGDLF